MQGQSKYHEIVRQCRTAHSLSQNTQSNDRTTNLLCTYETLAHTIHMIKKGWKQSTLPGVMVN